MWCAELKSEFESSILLLARAVLECYMPSEMSSKVPCTWEVSQNSTYSHTASISIDDAELGAESQTWGHLALFLLANSFSRLVLSSSKAQPRQEEKY